MSPSGAPPRLAVRVVDALLRGKMVELVTPRARSSLEEAVASYLALPAAGPGVLLGMLIDLEDVAEVYCAEDELGHLLRRIS